MTHGTVRILGSDHCGSDHDGHWFNVPPLTANMNAAFKKVSKAIDDDPVLGAQIATMIVNSQTW
jgi:hypothetical protein